MSTRDDLTRDLNSSNYRRRQASARAMGRSGSRDFLPELLQTLVSEKNPEVKATIIIAIACIGDLDVVDSIAPFLESSNSRLRAAAVKAMEHLGPADIFEKVRGLLTDSDNQVITMVVKALWAKNPEALLGEIKKLLASPNKNHRKAAVWAVSELQYSVARPLLNRAIYDNSISVRLTANDVLHRIEENLSQERARTEKPAGEQTSPAQGSSLSMTSVPGQPPVAEAEKSSSSAPSPLAATVREARSPGSDKTPEKISEKPAGHSDSAPDSSVPDLDAPPAETLASAPAPVENPVTPRNAAGAGILVRRRPPSGFQEMAELLEDQDPDIRLRVVKNIETSGESSMVPSLVKLLSREKNPHVVATLVKALGCLAGLEAAPHIMPHLESSDPRIVANTIDGLSFQPSMDIFNCLKPYCANENPRIMASAMAYCAMIDEDYVFDLISDLLDSEDEQMQKRGIRVLGDIGSARSLELLNSVYLGSSGEMRDLASQTMESVKRARKLADRIATSSREETRILSRRLRDLEGALAASQSRVEQLEENLREMEESLDRQEPERETASPSRSSEDLNPSAHQGGRALAPAPQKPFPAGMAIMFICVILVQQYMIFSLRGKLSALRSVRAAEKSQTQVRPPRREPEPINAPSEAPPARQTAPEPPSDPSVQRAPAVVPAIPAKPAEQTEQAPAEPSVPLSDEKKKALANLDTTLKRLPAAPSMEELRKAADDLQVSFYMGELYVFERKLQERDTQGALDELKKLRKMIALGYILWDFEKGEWISPKEE